MSTFNQSGYHASMFKVWHLDRREAPPMAMQSPSQQTLNTYGNGKAKESRLWLRLVDVNDDKSVDCGRQQLIQESTELMNIFGAILRNGKD